MLQLMLKARETKFGRKHMAYPKVEVRELRSGRK